MGLFNWKKKDKAEESALDSGLEKTRRSLFDKLSHAIAGKSVVDDEVLDSLEEVLIASDVGVETTQNIIERLEERVARDKYLNTEEVNRYLCEEIIALLGDLKTKFGITIITATHDMKMLSASDTVVWIKDGQADRIAHRGEFDISVGTIDGKTLA